MGGVHGQMIDQPLVVNGFEMKQLNNTSYQMVCTIDLLNNKSHQMGGVNKQTTMEYE